MFRNRRHRRKGFALALAACCAVVVGCTQSESPWPNRPIKVEVAYLAGNAADSLAHVVALQLSRMLRTPVVVMSNRAGTAGTAGPSAAAIAAARAPADGYTLLIASTDAMTIAPLLDPAVPGGSELCPLALIAETPHVLLVGRDSQADNLEQLVQSARWRPTPNYGSLGYGSTTHAMGELFAHSISLEMTDVPYRNSATAVADLSTGDLMMMFDTLQATLPVVLDGRLRALAVSSAQRVPELPDVPTFAERGYPELTSSFWYGLFAPCGLRAEVEEPLLDAARQALSHPDVAGTLGMRTTSLRMMAGKDFARFVESEREHWKPAVRLMGPEVPAPTH